MIDPVTRRYVERHPVDEVGGLGYMNAVAEMISLAHFGEGRGRWALLNGATEEILRGASGVFRTTEGRYKVWIEAGLAHRDDGPAVESLDGNEDDYFCHRGTVYARENSRGGRFFTLLGDMNKLHRLGGPAVEKPNGQRQFWAGGRQWRVEKGDGDLMAAVARQTLLDGLRRGELSGTLPLDDLALYLATGNLDYPGPKMWLHEGFFGLRRQVVRAYHDEMARRGK